MTRASDTTMVGQGLAAACVARGVEAITANKLSLEFAFGRAWRSWPRSSRFPQVRADLPRNDIHYILNRSERRQGVILAAWSDTNGWWVPYLTQELDDAVDLLPKFEPEVTWNDWLSLADSFRSTFRPEHINYVS